jgi:hypothetical protein
MKIPTPLYFLVALLALLLACTPPQDSSPAEYRVELLDGNLRRTYVYDQQISVDEFLRRVQADMGDLDRVNPPPFTPIEDGMTITIVRVSEDVTCRDESLPYETRRIPTDALDPGVEEVAQVGQNGVQQLCQRCIFENGAQTTCTQTSQTVMQSPKEQIIYYGTGGVDVPIVVEGHLAYISGGQAWLIAGNVRNRQPMTTAGGLDGRVFDLSPGGRQLLFSRRTESTADPDFANELWAVMDTANPNPVRLLPDNVLSGAWYPGASYTLSYSTAEPREGFPGWEAYNDLYLMRLDSRTGETLNVEAVVDVNAIGIYSYWGTQYQWSPDGQRLAWARADSLGLVDLEEGEFITLASFPHFDPAIVANWVWQPKLSWSYDSQILISTLHGPPYGGESPVNSVVFDLAVLAPERNFLLEKFIPLAGIWSAPQYSPLRQDGAGFPDYQIAYLQARDPLNSLGGEYDLVVADRDGSNPQVIFPPDNRAGLRPFNETQATEWAWSPSGSHIAIIYQGNLWIVEVASQLTQQITTDGQSSKPRWTN